MSNVVFGKTMKDVRKQKDWWQNQKYFPQHLLAAEMKVQYCRGT